MKFISVSFLEESTSTDKLWIFKYFKSTIKKNFARYFLTFRTGVHFSEHTGLKCSDRYVKKMKKIFLLLEKEHAKAKSNFDLELVEKIEMGNYFK